MFKLSNPLPKQLRDPKKLRDFFSDLKLVPYAGGTKYSSHKFLGLLEDLYELSPSKSTCIDDIGFWSFGGDFDVVRKVRPGLKIERPEVEEATKVAFYDFIENLGIQVVKLPELIELLDKDLKKTGNCYLRYREVELNGERVVYLWRVPPIFAMYLNTPPGEIRTLALSKHFLEADIDRLDDLELVRTYPNWTDLPNGRETIFHWKTTRDHSSWYGRPQDLSVLYWEFTEWQKANHSAKVADADLTSVFFLFMEKPDPNAVSEDGTPADLDVRKMKNDIKKVATVKGDFEESDTFALIRHPHGTSAPKVEPIAINRDTKWFEANVKAASDYIYAAFKWSKILSKFDKPSSSIGGNVLIDEFTTANTTTIKPNQRNWELRLLEVLNRAKEFGGAPAEFAELGFEFEDRVTSLVESLSEGRSATNATDQGVVPADGEIPEQAPETDEEA